MQGIVLPAPRYGKSSRGAPRLRRSLQYLHGALRLAAMTRALTPNFDGQQTTMVPVLS